MEFGVLWNWLSIPYCPLICDNAHDTPDTLLGFYWYRHPPQHFGCLFGPSDNIPDCQHNLGNSEGD